MTRTEVVIANMALGRLGHAQEIEDPGDGLLASVTDTTPESQAASFWFEKKVGELLEDFPWTFARKVALLAEEDDLSESTDYFGREWATAYTYPSDCARAWRFSRDSGTWSGGVFYNSLWQPVTWMGQALFTFQVADLADTKVILSNVRSADAILHYTRNDPPLTAYSELAASALAWSLAAEIGRRLNKDDAKIQRARLEYYSALAVAQAQNSNEELLPKGEESALVRAHFGGG